MEQGQEAGDECVCRGLWLSLYLAPWQISTVVWQKSTRPCKAIILSLKKHTNCKNLTAEKLSEVSPEDADVMNVMLCVPS